jgi:hypothetical protein
VVLASGADAVNRYPHGTIFIIIGDLRGNLAGPCYSGVLLLPRSAGLTNIVFPLYFLPLDALKTLAVGDQILAGKGHWHIELPEKFAFFTVMREAVTTYERLLEFYSSNEAQDLLVAANDRRTMDGLGMTPRWYSHEMYAHVYEDDFDVLLTKWTGYEDRYTAAMKAERLAVQLDTIPIGKAGAKAFEKWCHQLVRLLFKGRCDPIYPVPNGSAADRRDIVATNLGKSVFCDRILHDYDARHVVFEVKNTVEINVDALRQVLAYTGESYGRIAFVISRSMSEELDKKEKWRFRNMQNKGVVIVRLSPKFLLRVLRLDSQRECTVDRQFALLLDKYLLEFANEPPPDWRADPKASRTGKASE